MTTTSIPSPAPGSWQTYAYDAQTDDGHRLSGTIEVTDAEEAMSRLRSMRLRVLALVPAQPKPPSTGKALRGDDFIAFNEQIAQLAAAGLPLEQGLRLIAADIHGRRLKSTLQSLATELESGTPLPQAFDKYRGNFPPLYGSLVQAGVRSGDLSGVLLGLGRHLELIQRLRSVLWRTISYPLFVLIAIGFLLSFLGILVLPQYATIFQDFHLRLPALTMLALELGRFAPALLVILIAIVLGGPIAWKIAERLGYSTPIVEWVMVPSPLVGPVLRANMIARWCDAVRLGVQSGMDLPAAIELAGDATRSGRLTTDGKNLIDALANGRALNTARTSILPATVPAAIQYASGHADLASTLGSLSEMYQRQAELRLSALPGILTPLLLLFIAIIVGALSAALMLPFVNLLEGMTSSTPRKR
jgi:type II secretory pathway component PulF